ncbi:MAG: hypothetical protein WBM50_27830 [Acidimicrobiales bacterium]
MYTITSKLTRTAAAVALSITVLGAAVGTASAAPDRGDGPKTEEERQQQDACQLAYEIMEWAKTKRRAPDDFYDRLANGAFDYITANCDGVDIDTGASVGPGPARVTTDPTAAATGVVSIEPLDNPVPIVGLHIEASDNPIGR